MLLFLTRVGFATLFFYVFYRGFFESGPLDGVEVAGLMFVLWLGSLVMSILWAPVLGDKISGPLTAALIDGHVLPPHTNGLVRLIRRLQQRGARRTALALSLLEGLRYPDLPHPPLLALQSTRPGSLMERWMALEVYRYNNIRNCLHAYRILTDRHGVTPPTHPVTEVNLAIFGARRTAPPPAPVLEVPRNAAPLRRERDPRIRLFDEP